MTTMVGNPGWFGLSLPRQYPSMLNHRWWWVITLLSVTYRTKGWRATVRLVVVWIDWRYVYEERHSWSGTEEEPRSAVTLIMMLREEYAERERQLFLDTDSGFSRIVKSVPLHPLTDRSHEYSVVYPTEILMAEPRKEITA